MKEGPMQMPLPLDLPPPLGPPVFSLPPERVWDTLSGRERAQIRTIWLKVMGDATNEKPRQDRAAAP
jgi:hypothetical protein